MLENVIAILVLGLFCFVMCACKAAKDTERLEDELESEKEDK